MSVVVAFKYKDGMILGADKRVTLYGHLKDDNVSKIFHTKYSGHAIGCVGYLLPCKFNISTRRIDGL